MSEDKIEVRVGLNEVGNVVMDFGRPVTSIGLTRIEAIYLIEMFINLLEKPEGDKKPCH